MSLNSRKTNRRSGLFVLLILVEIGYGPLLRAQRIPTVRIDPHSHFLQQAAPFDHAFYLMIPVDSDVQMDEIAQLNISKLKSPLLHPTKTTPVPYKIYLQDYLSFKGQLVDTPSEKGFRYFKVLIDTQLLPNTRFSVILVLKPTHKYWDDFNKINASLYANRVADARKQYEDLSSGLTVEFSSTPLKWTSFENYQRFFEDSLQALYSQVEEEDTAILNNMVRLRDTIKSTGFKLTELFECNCQKDFVANELFADSTKFLIPLQNLLNVPSALHAFASGRLNIQEFEGYKQLKGIDFDKRVDNLGKLKIALTNVSYFFHLSSYSDRISANVKNGVYNAVLEALAAIDSRVGTLSDARTAIRKRLNHLRGLASAQLSFGGTSPMGEDLQTTSGHYVIPDFGLSVFHTSADGLGGWSVRPYLGVNISFIALDKSQPLRYIQNKPLLHRLSLVVGLTTSQLTRQGTADLINNLSIVTGLGLRINRSFRATFGTFIYKRDNLNPDLPQQVAFAPMAALSVDLDVAHWFSELYSKLY